MGEVQFYAFAARFPSGRNAADVAEKRTDQKSHRAGACICIVKLKVTGRFQKTKRCICGGRDPCCWWVACRTRPSQIHRLGVSRCAEGGSADTLQGKVSEV